MTKAEKLEDFKLRLENYYDDGDIVTDGIVDLERFETERIKILWILKEPYGSGAFDYSPYINDFEYQQPFPTSGRMWRNIIHITFSILNGCETWEEIDDCDKDEKVFNILRSLALINLKKTPGETKSYFREMDNHFNNVSREYILEQIELIAPDIIICGGTFHHIYKHLYDTQFTSNDYAAGYKDNKRLIVRAHHPSYVMSQENYCNSIIDCCRNYFEFAEINNVEPIPHPVL